MAHGARPPPGHDGPERRAGAGPAAWQTPRLRSTLRLEALPCHARTAHLGSRRARLEAAVGDGEDLELLLTFPAAQWPGIQQRWRTAFPRLPLTAIGTMEEDAEQRTPLQGGWVHF